MTNAIEQFTRDMKVRNLSPKTIQRYLKSVNGLVKYCDGKNLHKITNQEVQDFLYNMLVERGCSPSHVGATVSAFRFLFKFTLRKSPHRFLIPMPKQKKKLPEILSRQEVARLFRIIALDPKKMAFFSILYGCGLRGAEACKLRMRDIDRANNTLWVRNGKGGKDRGVYLPKAVVRALITYWRASHFTNYLFQARYMRTLPMCERTPLEWFTDMKHEAGINRIGGLHMFRHSYATHALEDGENLLVIKKHLGHSKLETTMIYLQLAQLPVVRQAPIDRLLGVMNPSDPEVW